MNTSRLASQITSSSRTQILALLRHNTIGKELISFINQKRDVVK